MKKQRLLLLAVLSVMLLLFMGSCSKDDDADNTPSSQQQEAPQIETQIVELPQAMIESTDPGATQAAAYVNMANGFVGWSSMMVPPEKTNSLKSVSGDPWIYTWEYNDGADIYAVTLTILETQTQVEWTMVINGTMEGIVLNDFLYMEANELLDGSSGSFVMYDWELQGIALMTSWSTDSNGVYNVVFEIPDNFKIEMTSNPDGSGSVMMYEFFESEYILEFHAAWTADGTGEYWEYYEGELMEHGTW